MNLSYSQSDTLITNLCKLYRNVGTADASPHFAMLEELHSSGWHWYMWSDLGDHPQRFKEIVNWCAKKWGTDFNPVDYASGTWYHFKNRTGNCTDQVFAFQTESMCNEFMEQWA